MGYSPWGHKESDMTERLHSLKSTRSHKGDGEQMFRGKKKSRKYHYMRAQLSQYFEKKEVMLSPTYYLHTLHILS